MLFLILNPFDTFFHFLFQHFLPLHEDVPQNVPFADVSLAADPDELVVFAVVGVGDDVLQVVVEVVGEVEGGQVDVVGEADIVLEAMEHSGHDITRIYNMKPVETSQTN